MDGLTRNCIVLQPVYVCGLGQDRRFLVDWDEVNAISETEHIEQLCYILRTTPVAPPAYAGDFTQDLLAHQTKVYRSSDKRLLCSEAKARMLGIANFTQIGRAFNLGGTDPLLAKMPIGPLSSSGSTGERIVNGIPMKVAEETIGGCLTLQAMKTGDFWGNESLVIPPLAGSDLQLTLQIGARAGGMITSCQVVRTSPSWNREIVNTRSLGRQFQTAWFWRDDIAGKQYQQNPTQGGSTYAETYPAAHPLYPAAVKRIFWQVPPPIGERKIYTENGSTVFETMAFPVEFSPEYEEIGSSGHPASTAGTNRFCAAWIGLRYRNKYTFHYRGLAGVIRVDHTLENDFDIKAWGLAPGTTQVGAPEGQIAFFMRRNNQVDVNSEFYTYDAATATRTAIHTLGATLWPIAAPPATQRFWIITKYNVQESGVGVVSGVSPIPTGRGGGYMRSTRAGIVDLCTGLYMTMGNGSSLFEPILGYGATTTSIEGTDPSPTASATALLSMQLRGSLDGGFSVGSSYGLRAGTHRYRCFFIIGTQAEVESRMNQLYAWGY